jgi:hypothetical protein
MMEGFSERTALSSSILELPAVMAITPMQAVGRTPIHFLVTGVTARIADQALSGCTPSDGGVHAGSPSDPALFASAKAYPVRGESVLRARPRNFEPDPRTDRADRRSASVLGLSLLVSPHPAVVRSMRLLKLVANERLRGGHPSSGGDATRMSRLQRATAARGLLGS